MSELGAKADLLRRLAICPLSGGMCYKTIFTTKLSNVDSRRAGAQHRSRLQPGGFLISSAKRLLQLHQFKHWHFVMADLRLTKVPNKPRCSSPMFAAASFNFDLDQCR